MLVTAASLAQTPAGHTVLRQVGLDTTPPSYTALSFAQPQALPARLPAPRTSLRVPFTIHNDSSGTRSYQWSLTASRIGKAGGLTARSVSGTSTLAPGATVTKDPALPLVCHGGQIRITIRLASPAKFIDFLSRCPTSPK
jgi:hypothetical protein